MSTEGRICRGAVIASFASIVAAVMMIRDAPSAGYESSPYESMPSLALILLTSAMLVGASLILYAAIFSERRMKGVLVPGITILLIGRLALLFTPLIRGYHSWQGDHMSQIGALNQLLSSGYVLGSDVYPVSHVLAGSISCVSGISTVVVGNYGTGFLSLLFILWLYIFSRVIADRKSSMISLVISGTVLSSAYLYLFMPNGWSILYLPLIFWLVMRPGLGAGRQYALLAILLMLPLFHPLSALFVVIVLVAAWITLRSVPTIKVNLGAFYSRNYNRFLMEAAVLCVVLLTWLSSHDIFSLNVKSFFLEITSRASLSPLDQASANIGRVGLDTSSLIVFAAKYVGDDLILVALSVVAIIVLTRGRIMKNSTPVDKGFAILALMFLVSVSVFVAHFLGFIAGLGTIGADRFLAYAVIFSPVIVGLLTTRMISKKTIKRIVATTSIVVLVFSASALSVLNLFPSPYTLQPNLQVSEMDVECYSWILEYNDEESRILSILSNPARYAQFILGDSSGYGFGGNSILDHFGYNENSFIGDSYPGDTYFVICWIDRITYEGVWAPIGRFTSADFQRLELDLTAQLVYSNGESQVWFHQKGTG